MPKLLGFSRFAALPEEQISENISRRILSGDQGRWSIGAGVHVEPHSHANEQIVWVLKGKMEFRLGTEQRESFNAPDFNAPVSMESGSAPRGDRQERRCLVGRQLLGQ